MIRQFYNLTNSVVWLAKLAVGAHTSINFGDYLHQKCSSFRFTPLGVRNI